MRNSIILAVVAVSTVFYAACGPQSRKQAPASSPQVQVKDTLTSHIKNETPEPDNANYPTAGEFSNWQGGCGPQTGENYKQVDPRLVPNSQIFLTISIKNPAATAVYDKSILVTANDKKSYTRQDTLVFNKRSRTDTLTCSIKADDPKTSTQPYLSGCPAESTEKGHATSSEVEGDVSGKCFVARSNDPSQTVRKYSRATWVFDSGTEVPVIIRRTSYKGTYTCNQKPSGPQDAALGPATENETVVFAWDIPSIEKNSCANAVIYRWRDYMVGKDSNSPSESFKMELKGFSFPPAPAAPPAPPAPATSKQVERPAVPTEPDFEF